MDAKSGQDSNRYKMLIQKIFLDGYRPGTERIEFDRSDLPKAAQKLGIAERNLRYKLKKLGLS